MAGAPDVVITSNIVHLGADINGRSDVVGDWVRPVIVDAQLRKFGD
jgi:hypothetical protein